MERCSRCGNTARGMVEGGVVYCTCCGGALSLGNSFIRSQEAQIMTEESNRALTNAIHRLRRAGDESGKTAQKLIDAANVVANEIVRLTKDRWCSGYVSLDLVRGYVVIKVVGLNEYKLMLQRDDDSYYFGEGVTTLTAARLLADDVASGLLEELAEATK